MDKYYIVVFLLVVIWACNPIEIPKPDNPEPVFKAEMQFNDQLVSWTGGLNEIVHVPSYEVNQRKPITYISSFKQQSCSPPCSDSWAFVFNGLDIYNRNRYDFSRSFINDEWPYSWRFVDDKIKLVTVSKRPTRLAIVDQWKYGNRVLRAWQKVPVKVNPENKWLIPVKANVQLCREVKSEKLPGILYTSCKTYNRLNDARCKDDLQVEIKVNILRKNVYELQAVLGGTSDTRDLKISWSTGEKGVRSIKVDKLKNKKITLKVINVATKAIATATVVSGREWDKTNQININMSSAYNIVNCERNLNPDLFQKGSVSLQYIDSDGKVYLSKVYQQAQDSRFVIDEILDYEDKNLGKKYKKVKLSFECVMYDSANKAYHVKNGKASIALDYPQ